MVIALVANVIALAALAVAVVAVLRVGGGPPLIGRTLILHTRLPDDRTVRGTVHGMYADRWTLREAVLMLPGGGEQALGGLQHFPRETIAWAQEVE